MWKKPPAVRWLTAESTSRNVQFLNNRYHTPCLSSMQEGALYSQCMLGSGQTRSRRWRYTQNQARFVYALLAYAGRTDFFKEAAFQGGTCLRVLYGLDRFSEDLDVAFLEPCAFPAATCKNSARVVNYGRFDEMLVFVPSLLPILSIFYYLEPTPHQSFAYRIERTSVPYAAFALRRQASGENLSITL